MRRVGVLFLTLTLAAAALAWPAGAQQPTLRLLGEFWLPARMVFQETVVGGLSGLAYDARRNVYYAVSDDRGDLGDPRFYTLRIDVGLDGIRDVQVVGVTTLDSDPDAPGIQPYGRNDSDMEEVLLLPNDELLISSEGDLQGRPWMRRFGLDGTLLGEVPMSEKFQPVLEPDASGRSRLVRGIRNNFGAEGLALSPLDATLYYASEAALVQDGPLATVNGGTPARLVVQPLADAAPAWELVYRTDPLFADPIPVEALDVTGVTALTWIRHLLSQFDLLALERHFATGVGFEVRIHGVSLADADDVTGIDPLPRPFAGRVPAKTLLASTSQLGIEADNLEGMVLGPGLPNGRPSLLLVADDNFSVLGDRGTQFLLFELEAPAVK